MRPFIFSLFDITKNSEEGGAGGSPSPPPTFFRGKKLNIFFVSLQSNGSNKWIENHVWAVDDEKLINNPHRWTETEEIEKNFLYLKNWMICPLCLPRRLYTPY